MAYVKTGLLDRFKDHTDIKFPRSAGFMGYFGSLIINIQTNWKTLKFSKHFFPLSTGIHMHQRVFFSNILIKTKEITFICLFMIYFIFKITLIELIKSLLTGWFSLKSDHWTRVERSVTINLLHISLIVCRCAYRLFLSDIDKCIHVSTQELLSHGSHAISIFPTDNQKKKTSIEKHRDLWSVYQ